MTSSTTDQATRRPWAKQGKAIREARRSTGLSQENFAAEVGTTRRHQIRIENGEHRPNAVLLARIAVRTNTAVDELGYPALDDEEESLREAFGLFVDLMKAVAR